MTTTMALSRRAFLGTTGALVVTFSLSGRVCAQATGKKGPKLPKDLAKYSDLDSWIRVEADGTVTVFTGKAELGQGLKTAILTVVLAVAADVAISSASSGQARITSR